MFNKSVVIVIVIVIDSIPKKNSAFCLKTSYFMNK